MLHGAPINIVHISHSCQHVYSIIGPCQCHGSPGKVGDIYVYMANVIPMWPHHVENSDIMTCLTELVYNVRANKS